MSRREHDFMELGDTGLVPQEDGSFYEKSTGKTFLPSGITILSDGRMLDENGDLIDPEPDEEDYR